MQVKTIGVALIAAAVLLAAAEKAPARTSVHWTAKAAPGFQQILRSHGSPSAVCSKASARVIRCINTQQTVLQHGVENCQVSIRLLSRTVAQWDRCSPFHLGERDVEKVWIPSQKKWRGWVA